MTTLRIKTAKVFAPFLQPSRYKASYGGRGSGKSHCFAENLIEDSLSEPGNFGEGLRSACIREVQKDLSQSSKALIETKIKAFGLTEADGFKIFRDVIQTPGDGLIIFKGMRDYTAESIKSLEGFKRAWWEEAQSASAHSIDLLRPTIRAPGSEIWFSWNPRRKTDPVDVMFRGPENPTGAIVVNSSWRDNPWFTKELEQERLDCLRAQPDQYEHIWEGGYVTAQSGAYFAKCLAVARQENRICRVPRDPLMSVYAFWDIGGTGAKADACAIWIIQFVGKEIRVIDYYEAVGQELSEHVGWMLASGYKDAKIFLPHDGVNHEKIFRITYESELVKAGFNVEIMPNVGAGAAMMRIEATRRVFPNVWIDSEKCRAGIDALGWYHEKKDEARGIGLGPDHDWSSHACDAFGGMAIESENLLGRAKIKPSMAGVFRR